MKIHLILLSWSTALALSACGGGDAATATAATATAPGAQASAIAAPSTTAGANAFPLQDAYKKRAAAGYADDYTVTGSCSGVAAISATKSAAASFEGTAALASTQITTVKLTDCAPANSTSTTTQYLDAVGTPLGADSVGVEYAKFAATPAPLATSVRVGDSATVVTLNTFTNKSRSVLTGRRVLSYVVEPDSASTSAIVNFVSKTYNTTNQLLATQQTRYRIGLDATMGMLSIDVQYSYTNDSRLIYSIKKPVVATTVFSLQQAYKTFIEAGSNEDYTVTGSCPGTANIAVSRPVATSFEGAPTLVINQTNVHALTTCSPANLTLNEATYFGSNYAQVGASSPAVESLPGVVYAKASSSAALPLSAKVGDAGLLSTLSTYASSAKATPTGRREVSYLIEPESATTALVNFTTKAFDLSDKTTFTQKARYRIDDASLLTPHSIDASYANGINLVYSSTRPKPAVLVPSFPLQQGYRDRILKGSVDRFVVSGDCTGSATISETSAVATNFEGIAGYSTNKTTLGNCASAGGAFTEVIYYDESLVNFLGTVNQGVDYARQSSLAQGLPSTVQVGDVGNIANLTVYANNAKVVATGRRVIRYSVEADTDTTALVKIITDVYSTTGQTPTQTTTTSYRIDSIGILSVLKVDVKTFAPSVSSTIFTPATGVFTLAPAAPL